MKFTIEARSVDYKSMVVEADSFDEAEDIYNEADGSEFHDSGFGDWELDAITCEDTGETVDYNLAGGRSMDCFDEMAEDLANYEQAEDGRYQRDLVREPDDVPGSELGRYEIVFDLSAQRYYCFCDAVNMNEALGQFFRAHRHIPYSLIVDHVEV